MKKLMFIAAATLAGAVFADDEIVSQNVVGYQQIATPKGLSMRTPTFKAVAGSDYKFKDIKVEGAMGYGDVSAQTVGADGLWVGEFYYLTEEMTGAETGWYKDMGGETPVEDTDVLTVGSGIFVSSAEAEITFVVAGEVISGTPSVPAPKGLSMTGNPTPVDVKFSAIVVDGAIGYGDVCAQTVGSDGQWIGEYYYLTEEMTGAETGWYKDMGGETPVEDTDIVKAGEALFMSSAESDITLSYPTVL